MKKPELSCILGSSYLLATSDSLASTSYLPSYYLPLQPAPRAKKITTVDKAILFGSERLRLMFVPFLFEVTELPLQAKRLRRVESCEAIQKRWRCRRSFAA